MATIFKTALTLEKEVAMNAIKAALALGYFPGNAPHSYCDHGQ